MSDAEASNLGPFTLGAPIGAGGMSEVFSGFHRNSGERVALKVTRFRSGDSVRRRAFVAEIAAMARMHHPGIVQIHDWGVLPDKSGNWCAMDLAPLGALSPRSITGWDELKGLLQQILDALGHAHACGVVHRDLKPQNVLVFGGPQLLTYRLADFGLAHSHVDRDLSDVSGAVAGTPAYMAPEQLHGLWREFGPWTDLYALGCMAFELATGRLPYWGKSPVEVAIAHLRDPLPVMVPRFAVPNGFERWVHALLYRDWVHRPRNAIAAQVALERLRAPAESFAVELPAVDGVAATFEVLPTSLAATLVDFGLTPAASLADDGAGPSLGAVPVPDDWRTAGGSSARFGDAGLELFAFRRTELVGHEEQRDELWSQLREVVAEGAPRLAIIEGEPDREREHIVDWMLQRAREVTTVQTVTLDLSVASRGRDPFRESIETLLTCTGLSGSPLEQHLPRALARLAANRPQMRERIIELLQTQQPVLSALRARSLFWELLKAAAAREPLVLSIKGLDRNAGPWFLVERILHSEDLPIHLIVLPRNENLEPGFSERLVRRHPHTISLKPQVLDAEEAGYVLDAYINLEPSLRDRWVQLAANDLPFAVDVLQFGTVLRGLRPTANGYELKPGVEIPSTPAELVAMRASVLRRANPSALRVLTVAAATSPSLSFDDWVEAVGRVGAELANEDIEALIRHGFVREQREVFEFEDQKTRTLLLTHLLPADRQRLLDTWNQDGLGGVLGRVDLLLAGGDEAAAAAALVEHVEGRARREDEVFTQWLEAAVRICEGSPALSAWVAIIKARASGAAEESRKLAADPQVAAVPHGRLETRSARAVALAGAGEYQRAEEQCIELLADLPESTLLRAEVCLTLGWLRLDDRLGRRDDAEVALEESMQIFLEHRVWSSAALVAQYLALLSSASGDHVKAETRFQQASDLAAKGADLKQLPRVMLERSTASLRTGDLDRVLQDAEQAFRLGIWSDPSLRGAFGANLAICRARAGNFVGAEQAVRETEGMLRAEHAALEHRQLHAARCVIAAMEGDVERWETLLAHARPYPSLAMFRDTAAAAWEQRGEPSRAAEAYEYLVGHERGEAK